MAKAIDCNSVIIGSNPIGTSITWGRGGIGRRNGLKIRWELIPVWVQVPPSPPLLIRTFFMKVFFFLYNFTTKQKKPSYKGLIGYWWRWGESNSCLSKVPRYNVYSFFHLYNQWSWMETAHHWLDSKIFVKSVESSLFLSLLVLSLLIDKEIEDQLTGCKSNVDFN